MRNNDNTKPPLHPSAYPAYDDYTTFPGEHDNNLPIPEHTSQKPKISIPEKVISKSSEEKEPFTRKIKKPFDTDHIDHCPGHG